MLVPAGGLCGSQLSCGQELTSEDWGALWSFKGHRALKFVACCLQLGHLWTLNSPGKKVGTPERTTSGNTGVAPSRWQRGLPLATIGWQIPLPLVPLLWKGRNTIAGGAWEEWPLLAAPSLPCSPSPDRMKSYNHTTLISPRMEGVVMATEHFLKRRNGVHYCSVSLAVAKRSVWQLFSIWILAPEPSRVECSSETLQDGKCGCAFWMEHPNILECFED